MRSTIKWTHLCELLNPNRIEERHNLKEGFLLHCFGPPANR
jgi:hypothetical protein